MTFDPLNFDVLTAARELRQSSAKLDRDELEKRAFELAETIGVLSLDEVFFVDGHGEMRTDFLLKYAHRVAAGTVRVVVNGYIHVEWTYGRGRWLETPVLLRKGDRVEARGVLLRGTF